MKAFKLGQILNDEADYVMGVDVKIVVNHIEGEILYNIGKVEVNRNEGVVRLVADMHGRDDRRNLLLYNAMGAN